MSLCLPARRGGPVRIDTSLAIVNIVLLLIFFFVVAGQDIGAQARVDLAETVSLPQARLPSPILVVDPAGGWALDGTPIAPALLPAAMVGKGETLNVMIDRHAPARLLIGVLARPETRPYRIRLVTLRGSGP